MNFILSLCRIDEISMTLLFFIDACHEELYIFPFLFRKKILATKTYIVTYIDIYAKKKILLPSQKEQNIHHHCIRIIYKENFFIEFRYKPFRCNL